MMNTLTKICFFLMLLMVSPIGTDAQSSWSLKGKYSAGEQWAEAHFRRGVLPPFSFCYGGRSSASFIRQWRFSSHLLSSDDRGMHRRACTYSDTRTGLEVECDVTTYEDFPAVEWVLRFSNRGAERTERVSHLKVADLSITTLRGDVTLKYAYGSTGERTDFLPREKELAPGDSLYLRPNGGRSSDGVLPFMNLALPSVGESYRGMMAAIGWTGTWFSLYSRPDASHIGLTTGIEHIDTYLLPGETVRSSSVCLMPWQGNNVYAGNNLLRRFLLAYHSRKVDGHTALYPVSGGFNWGDPTPCAEYSCLTEDYAIAIAHRYRQFKIQPENYWLDAGWYAGCAETNDWYSPVGNWTIDSTRFPNGFRLLSQEIHRMGSTLMVWFEPERVMPATRFDSLHPEWMLHRKVAQPANNDKEPRLFNLGNPEARQWLCHYVGDMIAENGIDIYRQDFNIEPERIWRSHDEPGREGITEMKYVEGLYTYWDYLLKRFPHLLIDNCASGGRRLDLETVTRSAPLWRTDYNYGEPNGYQCHTYGLNLFLPLHGTGTSICDTYSFRSSLGSAVVLNWKLTNRNFDLPTMQRCLREFRAIRPYFLEDYYPLCGTSDRLTTDKVWLAYELHRPSTDSGYVVAFRRSECTDSVCTVHLYGLRSEVSYSLTNEDTGKTVSLTGRQLSQALRLVLDKPRSSLILRFGAKR